MMAERAHSHWLIAQTAQSMAMSMYEDMATRMDGFAKSITPDVFCDMMWPELLEEARATLLRMLHGNYPEHLKEEIAQAIVLDNTLTFGRQERVKSRLKTAQTPTALLRTASNT